MDHVEGWFESVYDENYRKLIRLAYYILKNEGLAEDTVQSAFMTLLMKEREVRSRPGISKWLKTTVRNIAWNEMNKAKYKVEVPLQQRHEAVGREMEEDFLSLLPPGLSEGERRLLYLRVEQGYSIKEIAGMEGCTPEACRMRMWRARERCRALLEK